MIASAAPQPPQVTVLMSVFNGEAFVREAVGSILEQTHRQFEFIIIDDASTDRTADILRSIQDPRLRMIRNETNAGLTVNLNRGLALAEGEFVVRQDADDVSHPERIARQINFLRACPSVAAVGSQAWLKDANGRSQGRKDFPLGYRSIWWAHLFDNALAHSAVTFRRAAVLKAGGYNEKYRASQDYELWSRLGARHMLANLPDRLVTLRILASSITRTHRQPGLIREIQAAHAARLFPARVLSADELDLVGRFRSSVAPAVLQPFHHLFHDLLSSYQAAWPEVRISGDFCRTLAMQYERIGYNLLPEARMLGLREIARAIRVWPARIATLPWVRIAAVMIFGKAARQIYERMTSPRARSDSGKSSSVSEGVPR